jgi:hypothetical protein
MTKPTRHSEHVHRDKPAEPPAPAVLGPTGIIARRNDVPGEPGPEPPAQDPAMSQRYWVAIVLWAAAFVLMILYELISAIWRG